jgi:hypothetical protein
MHAAGLLGVGVDVDRHDVVDIGQLHVLAIWFSPGRVA